MSEPSIARQPRGQERSEAIARATLAIARRDGVPAITHRSVAREADVPLGSLTYYFPARQDLLARALELFVEEEVAWLTEVGESMLGLELPAETVVDRFAAALEAKQGDQIGQFELYLEAARTPELQPVVARAVEAYAEVVRLALRAAGAPQFAEHAPIFAALVDGIGLQRASAPDAAPDLRTALLAVFRAMLTAG